MSPQRQWLYHNELPPHKWPAPGPWQGQDNAGNPIPVIYYGLWNWPSRCTLMIPGSDDERSPLTPQDRTTEP